MPAQGPLAAGAGARATPAGPRREAAEEDPLLDKRTQPRKLQVLLMTIFTFPMSVIWSTMGMVVLPAEALWLYPGDESLYLGFFLSVVGLSQLICPVAGLMSDRWRSRWGRRRPFIFMGTVACVVSITGMWLSSVHRFSHLYFLCLFLSQAAINVIYSAQASIVPDFFKEKMGEVSGMVSSLQLGGQLFGMFYVLCSSGSDFHLTYGIYLVMLSVAGAIVCSTTHERPTHEDPPMPLTWQDVRKSFWIDLEGDRDFFWIFIGRTFFYVAVAVQTFIYYYMRDLMKIEQEGSIRFQLAVLALIATVLGLCASYPLGKISDKVGRKILVYLACAAMGLSYAGYTICPLFGRHVGMGLVYALGGLYGLGLGGYLSVDYALAIDCLPEKVKGSSEALGLWGIAGFIGSSIGPMLGGLLLEAIGSRGTAGGGHGPPSAVGGPGLNGHYSYPGYVILLLSGSLGCLLSALFTSFIQRAQ
mmetsp:Transcript_103883/g.293829  ORF Transcript_103883/g.293829 Transcript_103883/m.293829 type:complete len:473 (+) Transcript_103883:112-1530(+)